MRDRLIELLEDTAHEKGGMPSFKEIADHLLANGVIVPPCKVGQTIYMPWEYGGTKGIAFLDVTFIIFDSKKPYIKTDFDTDDNGFWKLCNGGVFYFDDFGKTVFLTKEQVEQALREREG
jgi:hypothetical protein